MLRTSGLLVVFAGLLGAQAGVPRFRTEDVRPHGSAEPYPLTPGLLTWIFGAELSGFPGCTVENPGDPRTYKTELCGTRVLVGGIETRLIAVLPGQINLVLPDRPWEGEKVPVQVVRDGRASAPVPVYFGFTRPVVSLAETAYAGMPVWVRVQKPWHPGRLRYPFQAAPWDLGAGLFEVRFAGRDLPRTAGSSYAPGLYYGWQVGLPREAPSKYLDRVPLHLAFPVSRAGVYQVRYTEYRPEPALGPQIVPVQSDWANIEVLPSMAKQRDAWFEALTAAPPEDTVELLSNFLPSLLARRDDRALRALLRYLDDRDSLVAQYSGYALHYFEPDLLRRVAPGRRPLQGGVR